MVTLAKSGNAIVFTFDDNDHYLNDGTIAVPVNSLTLVTDESQMATFKKSATNDIFISATYNELGMSKADLESWFKENACGSTGGGSGSGVTSGEVQTMIDDALVPYAESSAVTEEITEAVSGKADTSAVTEAVSGKMDTSAFTEYSASTDARLAEDEEVTAAGLNELNAAVSGKADTTAVTASIAAAVSGKADSNSVYTKTEIDSALSGKQDTLIAGTNITISGNVISAAGGNNVIELTQAEYDALTDIDPDAFYIITDAAGAVTTGQVQTMIDDSISGKADTSAVTASITAAVSGKQDTLVSGTNIKTINNESILGSGNIDIQGGGGGKAIEAGRGIAITTGATADTVSFNLPISAGTGDNSFYGNGSNTVQQKESFAFGTGNTITAFASNVVGTHIIGNGNSSQGGNNQIIGLNNSTDLASNVNIIIGESNHTNMSKSRNYLFGNGNIADTASGMCVGFNNIVKNNYEIGSGRYNNSVTGSTDSDKTIFTVGNGTADNARHNAFEIRQNGDIYITSGGTDIKLQDQLGGGGLPESAFTTYTAATEVRLAEDEEVTAAALNSLNDATAANTTALGGLKLVQLTQAQYDALATKDANTLYIITGSN